MMGIKSHREGRTSPLKTNPKAEACYKAGFSKVSFSDTDFFCLDVTQPISITLTLGSLPDALSRCMNKITGKHNAQQGEDEV